MGQPFLTQKVCQLLVDNLHSTTDQSAAEWVSDLVQSRIIDNWENHDNPEHLRTIRDRMLLDELYSTINLASYGQLLASEGEALPVNEVDGFSRLYLTGMIASHNGKVSLRTRIYRYVFNERWLQTQLDTRRPYAEKLRLWLKDPSEVNLLRAGELESAQLWSKGRHLPEEDQRFLNACQALAQREVQDWNIRLQTEIEQRKAAESELQNALLQLEEAKHLTEQASKAKTDFLARVSLEVRSPLNSLSGLSHLALQRDSDNINRDYLQKIHHTSLYMLGVVNDMVDIAKLERGELTLSNETFVLDDVLNNIIDITSKQIRDQSLELNLALPETALPALIGDPMRLQQILANLLINAIEHTRKGSITLQIVCLGADEKTIELEFRIIDTGEGFSESKTEGSVDKSDDSILKPGLSLSLCCELAALMNSALYAASETNQGATFYFNASFEIADIAKTSGPALRVGLYTSDAESKELTDIIKILGHQPFEVEREVLYQGLQAGQFDRLVLSLSNFARSDDFQKVLESNPSMPVHPLYSSGLAAPHWLSGLELEAPIQVPITPTRLQTALHRQTMQSTEASDQLTLAGEKRILVAEDNEINQQIIRELLEQQNIHVTVVNNGRSALNALVSEHFDLILMDIEMPVMDGLEAIAQIRSANSNLGTDHAEELPVIAMTAHALVGDRERFIAAGMNDQLAKPIKPGELYKLIMKWLPGNKSSLSMPKLKSVMEFKLDGLNTDKGLEICGGNERLYNKLLKEFSRQYVSPPDLKNLAENDLSKYVHELKGSSANLGLEIISSQAAKIEQAVQAEEQVRDNLIEELIETLSKTCHSLQQLNVESDQSRVRESTFSDADKATVLIVDKQLRDHKLVINSLRQQYRVLVADTAEKALSVIDANPMLDAAVVNIALDGDNEGASLCMKMIALSGHEKLDILLIGSDAPGGAEEAKRAGASGFLPTTLEAPLFIETVEAFLSAESP